MKHKYHDIIRAWEGKKNIIQYRILSGNSPTEWIDLHNKTPVTPDFFAENVEWRIKPLEYRVALMYDGHTKGFITHLYSDPQFNDNIEKRPGFERWLTDWIEAEI